ncbi:Concanavalin A-like lectin/glucanases superfamily, partial [Thermoplasmatales archaeon SCGC AB-539-N05]
CLYDNVKPVSSVDTISPYWNITGSVNLTATANDVTSGLKNVTLWYRYSSDNSSWDGWVENITDADYTWNWTFTFPNGTGYYEFYSIASDNASNTEDAPGSADTSCAFDNVKPSISFDTPPTPANNSKGNLDWAQVNVTVSDAVSNNISSFIDWNQSLVGYWNFEYTNSTYVFDNSSYQNNGSFNGTNFGESNITIGKYGNSLEFDGNDDFVNLSNHASVLNLSTGTLEVWFKTSTSSEQYVFGAGDSTNDWMAVSVGEFTGSYADESFTFTISQGGSNRIYALVRHGHSYYCDGNWHHAVIVVGSNYNKVYIDGNKESPTYGAGDSSTGNYFLNPNNLDAMGIGRRFYPNSPYYFNGMIDEVRLWNRTLAHEEINASYNSKVNSLYHNFTGLSDGNYTYYAHAIDTAGNENTTETRTLTIDTTKPSISFDTPPTPANNA